MPRPIRFNAFSMNAASHQSPGLWRHPRNTSTDFNRLAYWTDLARLLERGVFDALFIADVMGIYDVYQGSPGPALRGGVQVPVNDPMLLVPAMAAVTKHLGFGVTFSLTYEHPYPFARRMSTLDHLSDGRVGWNIVTGYLNSAARNLGLDRQLGHDQRYDLAEEYLQVLYKLWEKAGTRMPWCWTVRLAVTSSQPVYTPSVTSASISRYLVFTCASPPRNGPPSCFKQAHLRVVSSSLQGMPSACSSAGLHPRCCGATPMVFVRPAKRQDARVTMC